MDGIGMVKVETVLTRSIRLTLPNGQEVMLSEEDARRLQDDLISHLGRPIVQGNGPRTLAPTLPTVDKFTNLTESTKRDFLPIGFSIIGRSRANPRSNHNDSEYIYAKRSETGEYGFRIVDGKISPFHKLGRITDPNSIIGSFLLRMPLQEKLTRGHIKQRGIFTRADRFLKATTEILEIEGYLKHETHFDHRKSMAYYRTSKMDGLGVESNHEREVLIVSPSLPHPPHVPG